MQQQSRVGDVVDAGVVGYCYVACLLLIAIDFFLSGGDLLFSNWTSRRKDKQGSRQGVLNREGPRKLEPRFASRE